MTDTLFAKTTSARFEGIKKISSSGEDIRFAFNTSMVDINFSAERKGHVFNLESQVSWASPGQPDLPAIVKFVAIPPDGGIEAIVSLVISRKISDITPAVREFDALNSDINGNDAAFRELNPDNKISIPYEECDASGFWPPKIVEVGRPAIFRGYRLAPLIIHPIRWNPQTRQAEVIESADVTLNFQTTANRVNIVTDPDRPRPSRYVRKLVESLVANPEDLGRDEDGESGSIAYVMGRWNDVQDAIEPLLEWRRRMGWQVGVIRVNQNNDRQQVAAAIRDAYQNWEVPPEYVVLVGDAPGMQGNRYTIACYNEQDGARFAYETDHHYGCLEGDDLLPEAAVGRLVLDDVDVLTAQVNKIINYESRPYAGANNNERGWQLRAALAATDSRSGKSSIDVCNWFEELLRNHGYQNIQELFWTADEQTPNPTVFLTNTINSGVSFVLYRGWSDMNGFEARDIPNRMRNGRMLPFIMLATCNTGEYATGNQNSQWCYTENFARMDNAGAIGAVGAAGATHSAYNNVIAAGTMRGLFIEDIRSQGWALMRGKLDLMRSYQGLGDVNHGENVNMEAWLTEYYIFNLMGDPAVELFTGLPRTLQVVHPQTLRPGESWIQVQVRLQNDDSPAVGAQVCLYKADVFQKVLRADQNGLARFALDPAWTTQGTVQLTVTGHNLMTYMADLDVQAVAQFIGAGAVEVNDDNQGASRGDNDGVANPMERVELNLRVVNYGQQRPNGEAYVLVRPNTPGLQMVVDSLRLQSVPQAGQSTTLTFVADIGGSVPHKTEAQFYVTTVVGQASWLSMFTIPIEAPNLVFSFLEFDNDPLVPGVTVEAYLELQNNGPRSSPRLTGVLTSLTPTVSVLDNRLAWREIDPGEAALSDDLFRLAASPWHIPGAKAEFELQITSQEGLSGLVKFSVPVDRARARQPFGPDTYGYMCLDDTDTGWVSIPRFDWAEIDARRGGQGTNTGLDDLGEEDDASAYIQLPFNFMFYGQVFNDLTICTNGWMAFGDHRQLISARNRHIPSGEVIPAMLCPFWDDLITTANGGIY
ncbi:MAG: C25 family cysteine peptidase, partial [Calditrichota bacterium]